MTDLSQIKVTVSFGVATYPTDGQTPDELIAADSALYSTKADGRNRVSLSSQSGGPSVKGDAE